MEELIAERKLKFALRMFDIGAIEFERDELEPIRLNLRKKPGPFEDRDVYEAADLMFRVAARKRGLLFTHIAGIPNAGDSFAEAFRDISEEADVPARYELLKLSKEQLPDGKRRISKLKEGSYKKGGEVLMVDDRIVRGDSKLEAMQTLMKFGLDISGLVVLVDCEQGGAEKITKAKQHFVSVYTLTELISIYLETGMINEDQFKRCLGYKAKLGA